MITPFHTPFAPFVAAAIPAPGRLLPGDSLHAWFRAGVWLVDKARRQAAELGTQAAARNLRKQGVPLELALLVLTGRG